MRRLRTAYFRLAGLAVALCLQMWVINLRWRSLVDVKTPRLMKSRSIQLNNKARPA